MIENKKKPELKLFVIGESSASPREWGEWGGRTLVLALNEDHARELCDSVSSLVTEVSFTQPAVLCRECSPMLS